MPDSDYIYGVSQSIKNEKLGRATLGDLIQNIIKSIGYARDKAASGKTEKKPDYSRAPPTRASEDELLKLWKYYYDNVKLPEGQYRVQPEEFLTWLRTNTSSGPGVIPASPEVWEKFQEKMYPYRPLLEKKPEAKK